MLLDVLVTSALVVGGFSMAGWLAPSQTLYGLLLPASMIPTALYLKFRLPTSWAAFWSTIVVLALAATLFLILAYCGMDRSTIPVLVMALLAGLGPFAFQKDKK